MEDALETWVEQGLRIIRQKLQRTPDFWLFISVEKQLAFIQNAIKNRIRPSMLDRARINIGLLAAREFEDSDPELADLLFKIDYYYFGRRNKTNV